MSDVVYIFLDVDGVLNNENYLVRCYNRNGHRPMSLYYTPFDPKCLNNLMKLCQYLESNHLAPLLILSSTWRLDRDSLIVLNARLAEYGLRIFDCTEFLEAKRGKEIKEYLANHIRYKDYIIIDDEMFDIYKYHNLDRLIKRKKYLKNNY